MLHNIGYPSKTRLKLKSLEILSVHNIHQNNLIRTFGNREQPTFSFVGGKNAGSYGCYW